jgi:Skp family chaperone for outer membrane proteins
MISSPPILQLSSAGFTVESMNARFSSLLQAIQTDIAEGKDEIIQGNLLQLHEIQQYLYAILQQQSLSFEQQKTKQIQSLRHRMAHEFERQFLLQQIQHYQQFDSTVVPNLIQLAREETNADTTSTTTNAMDVDSPLATSNADLDRVTVFLGLPVDDSAQRAHIQAKIQSCIQERNELIQKIQQEATAVQHLKDEYKIKKEILHSTLPSHIQTIERATTGLAKILQSANAHVPPEMAMSGSERIQRLELAQQLAIPLYTLYRCLQHFIDTSYAQPTTNSSQSAAAKVTVEKDEVILHLPVPDVAATSPTTNATTKKKMVLIHFTHLAVPVPHIVVLASGGGSLLNLEILLEELFPNDLALNDTILASHAGQSKVPSPVGGKSYLWCNHLAGLYPIPSVYHPPNESSTPSALRQQHVSTRVVIQTLRRRIRANATLKHLLHSLQRCHVPMTPPLASLVSSVTESDLKMSASCKLTRFSPMPQLDSATSCYSVYQVEIHQTDATTSSAGLIATVQIALACYPAIPPRWEFQDSSGLYSVHLAQLAHRVNHELLDNIAKLQVDDGISQDENESVLRFCEWIMVYQIREIMLFVDTQTDSLRNYQGRDRKIV